MLNAKYKINAMAKDLNLKSKDLVDILTEKGFTGRSHTGTVEPSDYNVIINELTSRKQITGIDDYLNGKKIIVITKPEDKPAAEKPLIIKEDPKPAVAADTVVKSENIARSDNTSKEAAKSEPKQNSAKQTNTPSANNNQPKTEKKEQPSASAEHNTQEGHVNAKNNGGNVNGQQHKDNRNNQPANQQHSNAKNNANANTNVNSGNNGTKNNSKPNSGAVNNGSNNNQHKTKNEQQQEIKAEQKNDTVANVQAAAAAVETNPADNAVKTDKVEKPDNEQSKNRNKSQQQFNRPVQAQPQKSQKPAKQQNAKPQQNKPVENSIEQSTEVLKETSSNRGKIVDTRSSSVDLSKYDEKNDNLSPDMDVAGEKQKLKKQTGRENAAGKRDSNPAKCRVNRRGCTVGKNGRDMKFAGRDMAARKGNEKERAALEKVKRQELEKARKAQLQITIPDSITVGELAARLKVTSSEVVKKLFTLGVMANINQSIDYDTAYFVAEELGAKATHEVTVTIEEKLFSEEEDSDENLVTRAPVVVVMGHVDHGKTSLLDKIRNEHVAAGEAGGITQAIGAYRVNVGGKDITFLDTPGHEAFTAMRARGAKTTDIAILVVAADDGIMPQTIESISHAKDANLQIIVAINKMDKPGANPDLIKQELTKYDLVPEEWGGDVICVPVSALTGMGIDELLENVNMIAEMQEYKANPNRRAKGVVIESRLDKGRGPIATILVQNGTLHPGDVIIAGTAVGRVRAMLNENGKSLKEAGPSVPVEIAGLDEVPAAGDEFNAVEDERMARDLAEQRRAKAREDELKANSNVSLDDLFAAISDGVKELKIIVKADVAGSAEAVKQSLEKLSNDEVKVKIIHTGIGGITEGDVMFAAASNAIIIGFNVRPDKNAIDSADRQKVDIHTYRIIYECIEEIEAAMKGMLAPTFREELLGHAEVRQTIHVPNVGTIAGSYVQDGVIKRSAQIRVLRDSVVIFEDKISSLRRFKDDKSEVASGYECGIGLEKFNDIKVGDILEAFEMVESQKE